jgi:hypothetical protein
MYLSLDGSVIIQIFIASSLNQAYFFIYLFIQVYCPYGASGYERPTPHLLTDINIHSDTQAEPQKLSSLTLYIDLWQEGKPAPGKNPPVISPPMVIFRRIGVRAEIRTQNPVLFNTRLAKMVPLSHLRRLKRGVKGRGKWGELGIGLYKTGGKGGWQFGQRKIVHIYQKFKKWLFLVIKRKSKILEVKVFGGLARKNDHDAKPRWKRRLLSRGCIY